MKRTYYSDNKYKILVGSILLIFFIGILPFDEIFHREIDYMLFFSDNYIPLLCMFVFGLYTTKIFTIRYKLGKNQLIVSYLCINTKKIEIVDIRAVELIETYFPYYNIQLVNGKIISTTPIGNYSNFTEAIKYCRNQIDTNWHYTEKNTKYLG